MGIPEDIQARREARGWSQAKLAELAGTNQQTIDRIESGAHSRALPRVLEVLELVPATAAATFITPRPAAAAVRDLPVYASAQGGEGEMIINYEAIDYVVRPDPLASVRDGYAMYIVGESMSPAFEQGDLALVNPHLPYQRGNDVLLFREVGADITALVKRLVDVKPAKWLVEQFNPRKTFDLNRQEWPRCHVIVGKYSRR